MDTAQGRQVDGGGGPNQLMETYVYRSPSALICPRAPMLLKKLWAAAASNRQCLLRGLNLQLDVYEKLTRCRCVNRLGEALEQLFNSRPEFFDRQKEGN